MNTRKFTAVLLAMVLLAVPMFALGETAPASPLAAAMEAGRSTTSTITFVPGESLSADPSLAPVADLLKALSIKSSVQEKSGAVLIQSDLLLQDKPSLSMTEVVHPDGQITVKSNLLGEKAVSFNMEEYFQWIATQMEMQGNEEAAAAYKAYIKLYSSMLKGDMSSLAQFDQQSLQQDLMMPVSEWFTNLVSVPAVETGTYENEKHDTATTKMVYSLSKEQLTDLVTIISNWASKDVNLDAILSMVSSMNPEAGDASTSKADLQAQIKAMPEEFAKNMATPMQKPFTFTLLSDASGNFVAYELGVSVYGEDAEKAQTEIVAGYYVKTEADGKNNLLALNVLSGTENVNISFSGKDGSDNWQAAMNVKENDTEAFALKMDYTAEKAAENNAWKLSVEAGPAGQAIGVVLSGTSSTVVNGVDVKEEGKLDVTLAGQTAPIASIVYVTETGEPLDIPAFSDAEVVYPGKMTKEELEAWNTELSTTMMTQLGMLIQNLPASVTALLSGGAAF